jgi:D-alanyl-D-alanine carboxypeptidase/D-alanyl-D-alanine-endopeptidase (penicillin-binding protein 4)
MPIHARAIFALLLSLMLPIAASARRPRLPAARSRARARATRIPGDALSVYVREVGRDEPLVSYNSTVPRNPASTMKVLTTFAALDMLGPAYTGVTRAYARGPIHNGVLEGDLVLVGGGDPFLTTERWWSFVSGIRQDRISKIRGNIVIDNTLFAPQGDDRSSFDSRPYRTYNVLPDALLVGFPDRDDHGRAGRDERQGQRNAATLPANLRLDNAVQYQAGRCRRGGIVRRDAGRADRQSHQPVGPARRRLRAVERDACRDAARRVCVRHVRNVLAPERRHVRRRHGDRRGSGGRAVSTARVADAR